VQVEILEAGAIDMVSPSIGDIHKVSNGLKSKPSVLHRINPVPSCWDRPAAVGLIAAADVPDGGCKTAA